MDAAGAVDAENAPTAPWKTAQNAVSHSAHTHHRFERKKEQNVRRQSASHTKSLTLPHSSCRSSAPILTLGSIPSTPACELIRVSAYSPPPINSKPWSLLSRRNHQPKARRCASGVLKRSLAMPFDKPKRACTFSDCPSPMSRHTLLLQMAKRAPRTTSEKRRDRITRLESEVVALREAKAFMVGRLSTLRDELAILRALEDKRRS